jgi:hypothetical protein
VSLESRKGMCLGVAGRAECAEAAARAAMQLPNAAMLRLIRFASSRRN